MALSPVSSGFISYAQVPQEIEGSASDPVEEPNVADNDTVKRCKNILIKDSRIEQNRTGVATYGHYAILATMYANRSRVVTENLTVENCQINGDFANWSASPAKLIKTTVTGKLFDSKGTKVVK